MFVVSFEDLRMFLYVWEFGGFPADRHHFSVFATVFPSFGLKGSLCFSTPFKENAPDLFFRPKSSFQI